MSIRSLFCNLTGGHSLSLIHRSLATPTVVMQCWKCGFVDVIDISRGYPPIKPIDPSLIPPPPKRPSPKKFKKAG